jgi:hypothetical protein
MVQYDFGKDEEQFKHSGQINSVPQQLLAYLSCLQLRHGRIPNAKPKYLEYLEAQMTKIEKPDSSSDRYFQPHTFIKVVSIVQHAMRSRREIDKQEKVPEYTMA